MKSPDKKAITRRRFLRSVARGTLLTGLSALLLSTWLRLRAGRSAPADARGPLGMMRPPGALAEADFQAACIRCTRCADACTANAIRYFGPEGGALHGTPIIAPLDSACTMCLSCGEACPTGALEPLKSKEAVQIGTAVVDERLCVSINGTGVCGACFTACPLRGKAITQGLRNAPEVHAEFCTGCGLCESFCIVDERAGIRAIQVHTERQWNAEAVA